MIRYFIFPFAQTYFKGAYQLTSIFSGCKNMKEIMIKNRITSQFIFRVWLISGRVN